ncbi:MAG: aldo/keto reductase [Candidatus Latescibacterota bacterium]
MEFRKLGRTGLKVSEICLGTALFGAPTDEDEAHRMLDLFLDRGGNFVDTADVYSAWDDDSWAGRSEEMIGTWLAASGKRHEIVLATKARSAMSDLPNDQGLSRRHLMDAVEASLRRLQTDFIDLYQTHSMDTDTPIEETMRALDDLVRQGKVRYVGCSNYSAWRLCQALWASDRADVVRYECLQPVYNLLQREGFERDTADLIREEGLAVIPYSPQAAGFLTGKYKAGQEPPPNTRAASNDRMRRHFTDANFELVEEMERIGQGHGKTVGHVALAWHLSNPLITAPILGARNAAQLEESLGAAGFRLQEEEMSRLNALTEWRQD